MSAHDDEQKMPESGPGEARRLIFAMAAVGSLGVFSMHVLLPALPTIRDTFATTDSTVQLLISLGMLAVALGNLTVAPLSDRMGRNPVTLGALVLYLCGSVVATIAPGIEVLVCARVVQAFGGGAAMSVARASLTDYFGAGPAAASAMAYSAMAVLVVPMVAPTIGGFAVEGASWRASFVLTAVLGLAVGIFLIRRVRETMPPAMPGKPRPNMLRSYVMLLSMPRYRVRAICATALLSTVYTFIAGAPYVGIHVMGIKPSAYGLLFLLPALASFAGFSVAARLTRRAGSLTMIRLGVAGCLVAVVAFTALTASGVRHPLALFVPGMLLTFSNAVALPSAMASAIAVRPDIAGAASGLTGFLQLTVSAALTQVVAAFADQTPYPLAGALLVANLFAVASALLIVRTRHRDAGPRDA
jgi:DHA1 family bicyclomycin/chloramphenicol resistance-like MFS transporter